MKSRFQLRRFVFISFMVLAFLIVPFGQAFAITFGQVDTTNQFSNVGAIMISIPGVGNFEYCSGTLIGEREFLTAGHCTFLISNSIAAGNFGLANVKVSFHPLDNTLPASFWDVEALITHPDFKLSTANAYADVGVVILAKNPGLTPAQLAPTGFLDQLKAQGMLRQEIPTNFTVVGYGAQLSWPPPKVSGNNSERYFADAVYQSSTSKWLHYNQNPVVGNGGICYGDSGGPTYWTGTDGQRILVAVNSWVGAVNCNANGYSYRVDLPEIHDFIQTILSQY